MKLGLALSGGGFRASFFHLGVLRRLAELDLLRHVQVLSTVSGGSILAGGYYLRLADALARGPLSRNDYVSLVQAVERDFRTGVRRNLRTRLFWNPFANLAFICTTYPLGRWMARLYRRHLYGNRAARLGTLDDPGGLPTWCINATCLNTGRGFRLGPDEVGDPVLGFVRYDEVDVVLAYKELLAIARRTPGVSPEGLAHTAPRTVAPELGWYLGWWRAVQVAIAAEPRRERGDGPGHTAYTQQIALLRGKLGNGGPPAFHELAQDWDASRRLAEAELGLLRRARLAGGDLDGRWDALEDVDAEAAARLKGRLDATPDGQASFALALEHLYLIRSALAVSWRVKDALDELTLPQAVAASANFPPVFPPFVLRGLYDPARVPALALTDGGVHDNQGLEALLDAGCTHVIASDAGGLLEERGNAATGRLTMMGRIVETLMDSVRNRQLTDLRERRRAGRLEQVAFFHMASNPHDAQPAGAGYLPLEPHPLAEQAARLRTDLDAFDPAEMDALIYQGYQLADRFVRAYLAPGDFPGDASHAPEDPVALPPLYEARAWTRIRAVLAAGGARLFRAFRTCPAWPIVAAVAAVSAVVLGVLFATPSIRDAGTWLGNAVAALIRRPLLVVGPSFDLTRPRTFWALVLALVVLGTVWVLWPRLRGLLHAASRRLSVERERQVQVHAAPLVALRGRNVLWFVGWLPLWLALGTSLLALVVFLLDRLPTCRGRRVN